MPALAHDIAAHQVKDRLRTGNHPMELTGQVGGRTELSFDLPAQHDIFVPGPVLFPALGYIACP